MDSVEFSTKDKEELKEDLRVPQSSPVTLNTVDNLTKLTGKMKRITEYRPCTTKNDQL